MVIFAEAKAGIFAPIAAFGAALVGPVCANVRRFGRQARGYEAPAASSSRMRAFKMISILRMPATSATLPGLPLERSLK
jgi:hypothetical protein